MLTARRLLALPVVDDGGRLTGVLDISTLTQSLVDLERRESADEIFQLAGIHIEQERSKSSWWVLKNRLPWLLMNIGSGLLAEVISNGFDEILKAVVAITFFILLVLTLAESIAMQTVTMSLQSLQVTRQGSATQGRRMLREMRIGLLLGIISGSIVGLFGSAWLRLLTLAAVVAASIVTAGTIGAAFGYIVPRLVHRWKLDPNIASGPAVLAMTDVAALSCYLGLSAAVLR